MTTIGGPGGIGGPKGPSGPDGPPELGEIGEIGEIDEIDELDRIGEPDPVAGETAIESAQGAGAAGDVAALASEVAAGRLTAREAIDRLVDATAGPDLDATERAELRELLTDLVANDPYLGGLINRI